METFQYIPLRPRIVSWLQDEKTCRLLFDEMQATLCAQKNRRGRNDQTYAEFIDGAIFRNIERMYCGEDAVKWDLFIDISTDGFDVFRHSEYHCWPIVAMLHNLPTSIRFLMQNAVPLGFVKGPHEPVRLDTFLSPLVEELQSLNENGGTEYKFYNGEVRKIRVHVLWVKGDGPSSCKTGGFVGAKEKHMFRFCDIEGHKCSHCRSYYFPSQIRISEADRSNRRGRLVRKYHPDELPRRDPSANVSVFQQLEGTSSKQHRKRLTTETSVVMRTVLYDIPTFIPFKSFPLDVMHIVMNLTGDMVTLWKGEFSGRWGSSPTTSDFVIDEKGWQAIDQELNNLGSSTPACTFGRKPRDKKVYKKWKAAECKVFLSSYCMVLLQGHLPAPYLNGLKHLSKLVDLCMRPALMEKDVRMIEKLAIKFFKHFEKDYVGLDEENVHMCKSTVHALLHLSDNIRDCGPLVLCNQFRMERYIGYVKNRLNTTVKAAEALTEMTKLSESYKLFFSDSFVSKEDETGLESDLEQDDSVSSGEHWKTVDDVKCLSPSRIMKLTSRSMVRYSVKDLLTALIRTEYEWMSNAMAIDLIDQDSIVQHGRISIVCGQERIAVGAKLFRSANCTRANWHIAAEFLDEHDHVRKVHYGRVLFFLRCKFQSPIEDKNCSLYLAEWSSRMKKDRFREVYCSGREKDAFGGQRTIERCSTIIHLVGLLEHEGKESSTARTYVLDPQRETHHLFKRGETSPDGIYRILADVAV